MMTTWRALISDEMARAGDWWGSVIANTMNDEQMDKQFDAGYGSANGIPFTVWTTARVYFPVVYDGAENVGSVARYPDDKPTEHFGGQ